MPRGRPDIDITAGMFTTAYVFYKQWMTVRAFDVKPTFNTKRQENTHSYLTIPYFAPYTYRYGHNYRLIYERRCFGMSFDNACMLKHKHTHYTHEKH